MAMLGGATRLRPVGAYAQQPGRVYRLAGVHPAHQPGFLTEATNPSWRPFFDELRRHGFVEGQNLIVERYFGDGQTDGFADLAGRVVASKPDAIFCLTARMAAHMKAATTTIPIVAATADPVAWGLVSSLARPGGNLTGVVSDGGHSLYAKHLELLRETAPATSRIAYLAPRAVWDSPVLESMKEAATQLGVRLLPALLDSPIGEAEYRRVLASIGQSRPDALIVGDSAENYSHGRLITELVASGRLPAIYPARPFTLSGGLMSYGVVYRDLNRRLGAVIAQILNGTNPGDIPFSQATHFELVINLRTAGALGLTIPPAVLARADEVIE